VRHADLRKKHRARLRRLPKLLLHNEGPHLPATHCMAERTHEISRTQKQSGDLKPHKLLFGRTLLGGFVALIRPIVDMPIPRSRESEVASRSRLTSEIRFQSRLPGCACLPGCRGVDCHRDNRRNPRLAIPGAGDFSWHLRAARHLIAPRSTTILQPSILKPSILIVTCLILCQPLF
jgi:hypothetical protein